MRTQPLWTRDFWGTSLSSFFQYVIQYALIAALPIFVVDTLHGNNWSAGLTMTFFQLGAVSCRPLAGKWIDEIDKKTMLMISLGMFLLVSILYLRVDSLNLLLGVRLLHGAVFAMGTTALATVAALILPSQRKGEGIGYFAMFTNLAMVVGPYMSLWIMTHYQYPVLFIFCASCAAVSFYLGYRPGLLGTPGSAVIKTERSSKWHRFLERKAIPIALIGGLLFFAYTAVLVFLPLYAKQLYLADYTSAFFAVFALVILATRPIAGKFYDRHGADTVVYPGFMLFVLGLIALSAVQGFSGFLRAAAVLGAGFGALAPAFQTLAVQSSPGHRVGVATATYFWSLDISVALGSIFQSVVASHAGYRSMYLFSAAIVGIAALAYYFLDRIKTLRAK